jgi:hypothetical protein
VRNHNEYETWSLCHCKQEHTAWFAGPNIHYGSRDWFFTLTVLPQIYAKGFNAEQRAVIKNNLIYGDEHARFDGIRLKVGFFF